MAAVRDLADRGAAHLPLLAKLQHGADVAGLDHRQHPLLGLGDHHLEGLHAGLAQRHPGDVDLDPDPAGGGHLARRGGQPGGAEVLEGDEQPFTEQLQAALEQLRLLEGVADLHAGALRGVLGVELGRGQHRGAADPVAPGRGTEDDDRVADSRGRRPDHLRAAREADAHCVDQAALLVGGLEVDLAADGRHPDRVAVVGDPADRAVEQVAGALRVELAEAQRVEHRDRPSPEGEDVAEDPADPGRRPLERLDRARVVVGLDLEGDRVAGADVHRPGVLARSHHHPLALGGQAPQQPARVLVGAVLGPEQREHRQLDAVGLAPDQLADAAELRIGEPQLAVSRRPLLPLGHRAHAGTPAMLSNSRRPSVEPVRASTACSGWGIRPSTLPASLVTPAISLLEPLGFSPGA